MFRATDSRKFFARASAAMALLVGFAVTAHPASAQPQLPCGARENVVSQLAERHAEAPTSMGLAAGGAVVELFSTADGTTWTIVVTTPDGKSCLLTHGETWMSVNQVVGRPA